MIKLFWYFISTLKLLFIFLFKKKTGAMDVTRQNFEEVLPKVKKSIEEATFLSIDCELTGLNTIRNINAFDTIEQYYNKVRENCREFLVIQYGITAFKYDEEVNIFKQSSYNFYIFRRPLNRNIPDQRFLCQTSSIDFLISQGFDFNKLFREGISYLNLEEETKYSENLEEKHKEKPDSSSVNYKPDKIAIPPTEQQLIDDVMKSIDGYLKGDETEPLQLPKCNPFCRKLIYQETADVFGDKICVETKQLENKDRVLHVTRVKSADELKSIAKQKYDDDMKILNECIGFTRVLRMIVESGKLVVGHNLLLDILHTIDKFLTPLPDNYEEFKECVHNLFPNILDTKFMSSSPVFRDLVNSSALGPLVDTVKKDPFEIPTIEIEDDCCGYSLDDKKEHEAAFDAFITGVSFLAMWNYIGKEAQMTPKETFSSFNLVEPYFNKIFLMRLQDNPYINLSGNDPNPSRDHVFHVTFPNEWKTIDIQQLFSPFGNVFVSWINDSSAFVGLYKRDQATIAYKSLKQNKICAVKLFHEYHHEGKTTNSSQSLQISQKKSSNKSPYAGVRKRKISEGSSLESIKEKVVIKKKKSPAMSKTFTVCDEW
ncbi:poly(A)-specific ribonuclease PARN-like [Coccinella septempunctata]|uniref:poly(A)-specific ribonuclease PARN-like n=1 Tax=Coccinella septempunctata TaxID=41139 RepID=UPI001D0824F2|nr:poly(A)-specific ribonuclease PARN-like [Coccinella septempunctata]